MGAEQSRSRSRSRSRSNGPNWSSKSPKTVSERTAVLKKCGRRCFLGPNKSFPVCSGKGTARCKIDRKGVQAAYSRAREWASITSRKKRSSANGRKYRMYTGVARRAKTLLSRMKK
jgi:hypothetical protein